MSLSDDASRLIHRLLLSPLPRSSRAPRISSQLTIHSPFSPFYPSKILGCQSKATQRLYRRTRPLPSQPISSFRLLLLSLLSHLLPPNLRNSPTLHRQTYLSVPDLPLLLLDPFPPRCPASPQLLPQRSTRSSSHPHRQIRRFLRNLGQTRSLRRKPLQHHFGLHKRRRRR